MRRITPCGLSTPTSTIGRESRSPNVSSETFSRVFAQIFEELLGV